MCQFDTFQILLVPEVRTTYIEEHPCVETCGMCQSDMFQSLLIPEVRTTYIEEHQCYQYFVTLTSHTTLKWVEKSSKDSPPRLKIAVPSFTK